MLKYCLDRCKTQEMCDKAVDFFLPTLKFASDWFVTYKMLQELDDFIFSNDDIVFVNKDSDNVIFSSDDMGLNTIYLDNINLHDDKYNNDGSENIIRVRLTAWCNRYKQRKTCKKQIRKELMSVAWYPTRLWDQCLGENEKSK